MGVEMISPAIINQAAEMLTAAAPQGSRVFLFGSQATGTADPRSDVDFLVVEPHVSNRIQEMLRLAAVLRPLMLPVDLLVMAGEAFEYWKDTPNSIAYRVAKEGRLCGSAA